MLEVIKLPGSIEPIELKNNKPLISALNVPEDWWQISMSYQLYEAGSKSDDNIPVQLELVKKKNPRAKVANWDVSKGDYIVRDNGPMPKSYLEIRKQNHFLFFMISLLLSSFLIYSVLDFFTSF